MCVYIYIQPKKKENMAPRELTSNTQLKLKQNKIFRVKVNKLE